MESQTREIDDPLYRSQILDPQVQAQSITDPSAPPRAGLSASTPSTRQSTAGRRREMIFMSATSMINKPNDLTGDSLSALEGRARTRPGAHIETFRAAKDDIEQGKLTVVKFG